MTGTVSMIDDVLVFSKNEDELDIHLDVALGKTQRAVLTWKQEKC